MPEIFGRYNLNEVLGEEGTATVYRALDSDQDIEVQIKVVQTHFYSLESMPLMRQRFDQEVRPITQLKHENLRGIIDFGEKRGKPFLVQPWLDGSTLEQKIKSGRAVPWQEALSMILPVIDAIMEINAQGFYKQQILPANIFETVEGVPYLQNIYSSSIFGDEATLEPTYIPPITPRYAAPEMLEQANGTSQSEIFSLGAILCELVTGKPLSENHETPDFGGCKLPKELESSILQALQHNPSDRFSSLEAFATALQLIPNDLPEMPEEVASNVETVKEEPAAQDEVLMATHDETSQKTDLPDITSDDDSEEIVFTLPMSTVDGNAEVDISAKQEGILETSPLETPELAEMEPTTEVPPLPLNNSLNETSTINLQPIPPVEYTKNLDIADGSEPAAILSEQKKQTIESKPLPVPQPVPAIPPAVIPAEAEFKIQPKESQSIIETPPPPKPVNPPDISLNLDINTTSYTPSVPKKKSNPNLWIGLMAVVAVILLVLVLVTREKTSIGIPANTEDPTEVINPTEEPNVEGPFLIQARLGQGTITGLDLSSDERTVVLSTSTGIYSYSVDSPSLINHFYDDQQTRFIQLSADGTKIATTSNGELVVLDSSNGEPIFTYQVPSGSISCILFTPNNEFIILGTSDSQIYVINADNGVEERILSGHTEYVRALAISSDSSLLASSSRDDTVKLWDVNSGYLIYSIDSGDQYSMMNVLKFGLGGQLLAAGDYDGTIKVWNAYTGDMLGEMVNYSGPILSLQFSPDGSTLTSTSANNNTVTIWGVDNGVEYQTYHDYDLQTVGFAELTADGYVSVSTSSDGQLMVWNTATNQKEQINTGFIGTLTDAAYSPDGRTLVTSSEDNLIYAWDTNSRERLQPFIGHTDFVNSVDFSPDGKTLASSSWDGTVLIWDVNSRTIIQTLDDQIDWSFDAIFSPDGSLLAASINDKTIVIWETSSWNEIARFTNPEDDVNELAFSPDGKYLAGITYSSIYVWETGRYSLVQTLTDNQHDIYCLSFTPEGTELLSGNDNGSITIWNYLTGAINQVLSGHDNAVSKIVGSPDGQTLASSAYDGTIILWDANSKEKMDTLKDEIKTIESIAFSPEGNRIASASYQGLIMLWEK